MSKKQIFTKEFKDQIVALYNSGKRPAELLREYGIVNAFFYKRVKEQNTTGSYKASGNRTPSKTN